MPALRAHFQLARDGALENRIVSELLFPSRSASGRRVVYRDKGVRYGQAGRHVFVTCGAAIGVPEQIVEMLVGHRRKSTVHRAYQASSQLPATRLMRGASSEISKEINRLMSAG
jgi:hypothetical protein